MVTVVLILFLFLLLYRLGFLTVSLKRAVVFVGSGSWGSRCVGASFTGCGGRIQRVVRFSEGRSYSFRLSGHIQQGSVAVRLLDGKRPVLELGASRPSGVVSLEAGKGYTLYILFENASGDYQLEWD